MPKALHDKLVRQGSKKGYVGDRLWAYVYGTLTNIKKKLKAKGKKAW